MVTLEQVNEIIGQELPALTYTYTTRDVILYALGVGAPANWLDRDELAFVYERHPDGLKVLPSFPVIYSSGMIDTLLTGQLGPISYNPMMLVHGEQYVEVLRPLPPEGTVTCRPVISGVYDKGSGMLVVTDVPCYDEQGEQVALTRSSMFIRGLGGYGGERGESQAVAIPERAPDAVVEETTLDRQALIYRLSGDVNPLHVDPQMAAVGQFDRPILHGLCTFGFAVRAVLKRFCDDDPARFHSVGVRFSKHVFPGETLVTEMWQTAADTVVFQTKSKARDVVVLSNATARVS